MSHPLSFVDRWLCPFLYQNSPLHAHPLPYTYTVQLHRIFYTHFTSHCQQERWCWRLMHTHFVRIFTKIFWWYLHIWCNYQHLIPTTNKRVPIVQCREDKMPFTCVLLVAILLLLSTLRPRWRATSLTLMMMDTQPCTRQPKGASCPWWSTSWDHTDLMWRPLTKRLACIVCCLSDTFCDLSGHTCTWAQ